jgi:hypothetical protein
MEAHKVIPFPAGPGPAAGGELCWTSQACRVRGTCQLWTNEPGRLGVFEPTAPLNMGCDAFVGVERLELIERAQEARRGGD